MRETKDLTEIKLILLFVLEKLGKTAPQREVVDIILMRVNVNYFSLLQYLSELIEDGYIIESSDNLSITEKGKDGLSFFIKAISASNRKKLETEIQNRLEPPISDVSADFYPVAEDDFKINTQICENGNTLMKLMMSAASVKTAKNMCASFYKNKDEIYNYLARILGDFRGFKAVVFDLDGTLIDTLDDLANSTNAALAACGYEIHARDKYKTFVGNGALKLIERALPESARNPEEISRVRKLFNEEYDKRWEEKTLPYPGIFDVLDYISKKGMIMGVLSNKPDEFTQKAVNRFFSDAGFSFVYGSREGIPNKPDPCSLLAIAKEYGLSLEDILYIGDSDVDMILGKNANVFSVGAAWGFRGEKELIKNGATFIAKTPKDILKIIG